MNKEINIKKDLVLNMLETLLRLYENQEQIIITGTIKNPKNNRKYLYKNGKICEK